MPLIQVFTSAAPLGSADTNAVLGDLSRLLAERFAKPERWVMTCILPELAMTFGGTGAPSAFVAVKNVGKMTPEDTAGLSKEICSRLALALAVPIDRIYIEFSDAAGYLWGWNAETFG